MLLAFICDSGRCVDEDGVKVERVSILFLWLLHANVMSVGTFLCLIYSRVLKFK